MNSREVLDKYLNDQLKNKLTAPDAEAVFVRASKDYFSKKIQLEDLTFIAVQLYFELLSPSDYEGGVLCNLIDKTADLDYYIKKAKNGDKEADKYLRAHLRDLKNYINEINR
jgi:hypothetical protein